MLDVVEARKLTDALRYDWEALRSMLADAVDNRVWETLDYARKSDWIADVLGDVTLPGVELTVPGAAAVGGGTARVSRPGRSRSTQARPDRTIGRTDVTPRFKTGR